MSNFKQLTNTPVHNFYGELISASTINSNKWIKLDGSSILSQSAFPQLFSIIGILPNNYSFTEYTQTVSNEYSYNCITYGKNIFVLNAYNTFYNYSITRVSTNGINWGNDNIISRDYAFTISYGQNIFVRGGKNGMLENSTNGVNWSIIASSSSTILEISYSEGLFMLSGSTGKLWKSTDGINWTGLTALSSSTIYSSVFGKNNYAYITNTKIVSSTDGSNWVIRATSPPSTAFRTIVYGNNIFVCTCDNYVFRSTDSINWSQESISNIGSIVYYNGFFFQGTKISINGLNWQNLSTTPTVYSNRIFGQNKFIMAAQINTTLYTINYSPTSYNLSTEFCLPKNFGISVNPGASTDITNLYIKGD